MAIAAELLLNIIEASLLVAGRPMSLVQLEGLFEQEVEKPTRDEIREALAALQETYVTRGIELVEVASGFRMQARQEYSPWISNLFQERAPRYSRALLETLVLIAYRQPITRGEIEDVRGVAVSSNIIKTLLEREWIRVLGHRDVPGRPAILGTTRQFLDYFNLKRIDELPTLSEIKDLDQIDPDLAKELALLEGERTLAEAQSADMTFANDSENGNALTDADDTLNQVLADAEQGTARNGESTEDNGRLTGSVDLEEVMLERDSDGQVDVHLDLGDKNADLAVPEVRSKSAVKETETLH